MPQLSLYLPDELMTRLRGRAEEADVSLSAFVTGLLERALKDAWPEAVADLAGAWPDFPTREDLLPLPDDPPREPLA